MAEGEDSATVLTILKSLDETVKTLKADNKCLLNRIEILEAPPQNSGVVKQVLSGAEPNSEDQNRDVFEASETMMESDEEVAETRMELELGLGRAFVTSHTWLVASI